MIHTIIVDECYVIAIGLAIIAAAFWRHGGD